jgi:ParB-like chromosome segregation protein Spo0J
MSSTTLTIDQLRLSPLNVRTYGPDANDTEALQASILAEGRLINAIAVHAMRGKPRGSVQTWGAIAGGRRYRAIKALIERGDLPADWPVPVTQLDPKLTDAELIEYSITENLLRRDLRDHELFAGVARAAARGHAPDTIARNLGQPDVTKVAKWLRMGQLAQPVFAAFSEGRITLDQARAFAATGDADLQAATFTRFGRLDVHQPSPAEIRRAMAFGDAIARRELLLVGDDAYRAAGGAFELDLFAEDAEERGRVTDRALLSRLVDERLVGVRDQVRVTTQRRELRFVPEPPQNDYGTDHQLSVTPKRLSSGTLELPEGEIVAHITIDASGEPIVSYWWASRTAKYGSEKPKAEPITTPIGDAIKDAYQAQPRANAAIRQEEGLSADAVFAMRAVRKAIMRAGFVDDAQQGGEVGLDYLVWAQARQVLAEKSPPKIGMWRISGDNTVGTSQDGFALARDHVAATPASRITAAALQALTQERFFTEPDLVEAFRAYRIAHPVTKATTAALVAGFALDRSLNGTGYEIPIHDELARQAAFDSDQDVRDYWQPTADMIDLFPKEQRRGFAEPFVSAGDFATWAKLKSSELTAAVVRVLTRPGGSGARWVHPLLRFQAAAGATCELEEAA